MEGVEVPPFFLCPISLQIMRDPVTISTGITFDRDSIERWIFSGKNNTCPVTKQPLIDLEMITPNHTLRRLIQAWCAANASNSVEQFPTPRPPVDKSQIAALLDDAKLPQTQIAALRKLKAIVVESDRNKHVVEASGGVDVLVWIMEKNVYSSRYQEEGLCDGMDCINSATDEALSILCSLQLSEESLLNLIENNVDLIELLTKIMSKQGYQSRAYAVLLVKSLIPLICPTRLSGMRGEFYEEILKVIKDGVSLHARRNALEVLGSVSHYGRNKVKVVQAGSVPVLVEQLLEESEKRVCEMILTVLESLCRCAEGRADLVGHAAGIAVVSKKIMKVSPLASGMAVRILYSVAKFSPSPAVLHEMVQVGAVNKLFILLQLGSGVKVRDKVKEIIKLNAKAWRSSPCISPQLQAIYPSTQEMHNG